MTRGPNSPQSQINVRTKKVRISNPRSKAAARQALRRSREARGLRVYQVEAGPELFRALELAGLLPRNFEPEGNRDKIVHALAQALRQWEEMKISSLVTLMATGRE